MSERILTDSQIRRVFALAPVDLANCTHVNRTPDYAARRFDDWLAAHDEAIRAEECERIAVAIEAEAAGLANDPGHPLFESGAQSAFILAAALARATEEGA